MEGQSAVSGPLYVVDTCILVDHLRGYRPAKDWLTGVIRNYPQAVLAYSVITLAELASGLLTPQSKEATERLLGIMRAIPLSEEMAWLAGSFVGTWRASHGLELPDALIAATAKCLKAPLVTRDRSHFPVEDLPVIAPY
ncbi:MAG: type II toxin-antitoxin system VapC family toxin [Bacillota bacterium]|nr:type II toxin-antitoxin system VapC family toxin [Bacillota bacterium]